MQYIPIITLVLVVILLGLVIVLLTRKPEKPELPQQIDPTASITALGTLVTQNRRAISCPRWTRALETK